MGESILQSYLNAQHIKTSEQENITNLKKVVAELKKKLEKKRDLIISYTLVALDPNINSSEPVVQEVESIIIKKWPAFKNSVTATKDKSTTYVRAVILESLSQMAGKDDSIAAIVWHTARDIVSYYSIGVEKEIIESFLQSIANQVEEAGRGLWGISNKVVIEQFEGGNINIDIPSGAKVDEENLSDQLKAALVHSGWSSQAGGGENPRHQGQQDWQWPKFAAERAAKGITEEINSALSRQSKSLSSISVSIKKSLDDYFSALQPFLEQISSTYANNIVANNKRSELLWWKQTLCSPRLGQSYRGHSILETVILMAIDLSDQVDAIYPISVDYLLKETLKDIHSVDVDVPRSLSDWVELLIKLSDPFKELLKPFGNENEGRKSLLTELSNVISAGEADNFFKATGIDDKASISASSLAVWVFHELQAYKMAATK